MDHCSSRRSRTCTLGFFNHLDHARLHLLAPGYFHFNSDINEWPKLPGQFAASSPVKMDLLPGYLAYGSGLKSGFGNVPKNAMRGLLEVKIVCIKLNKLNGHPGFPQSLPVSRANISPLIRYTLHHPNLTHSRPTYHFL